MCVCFIAVWIRFEINVLNWCSIDWGFEGLIESLAQYAKAELLFYQFFHLLKGKYYRANPEHKRRSASAELSSEGITLCATNFSAAHKEFMKCAIKTRKLKLGSTQMQKIRLPADGIRPKLCHYLDQFLCHQFSIHQEFYWCKIW